MSEDHSHTHEHPFIGTGGGGRLQGDPGLFEGEGHGHIASLSAKNEFSSLRDQKSRAEHNFIERTHRDAGDQEGTCATEDHSFMTRKPGAVYGWEKVKKDTLGNIFG
ncbi:hypothetical protein BDV26DRAFT_265986 [Aspergillus bertholletiae]|uniref:Uncharacterized protein n=1 Tax=Aspergillus bertholletiae TaxID=1226010 RepID=A0A5N7B2K9_9EURO|nr:hypothetical protein BDV26DRAFT_265986 [Aspergillus bertholletiae]